MKTLRRKVYVAAGSNTVSMGTGRKEFHPKKPRPGLEHYIFEAGRAVLKGVGGAAHVDEGVIGNFMAGRFNNQGNLAALIPAIDEGLMWKPCSRLEGACCSGALALVAAVKSVLAESAEMVLTIGVEVQNTVKALYGADILATAGWSASARTGTPTSSRESSATAQARTSRSTAATSPGRRWRAGTASRSRTRGAARRRRSTTTRPATSRPRRWPSRRRRPSWNT